MCRGDFQYDDEDFFDDEGCCLVCGANCLVDYSFSYPYGDHDLVHEEYGLEKNCACTGQELRAAREDVS